MNDTDDQTAQGKEPQNGTNANLYNIKISIDALTNQIKATATEQKEGAKWPKRATYAAIAYTVITAVIFFVTAYQAYLNRIAIIEANRAWLATTHFEFSKPIDALDGPTIISHFQNVGRFPALDVRSLADWFPIDLATPIQSADTSPDTPLWPEIREKIRERCSGTEPIKGGPFVFPNTSHENSMVATTPVPFPDKQPIQDGRQIILVTGCLAYRTFDNIRHTGFCQYASKIRTGQWEFFSCPMGNFAN